LSNALRSLKSFTAHEIKKLHPEMASIWQHESFDRYVRNENHYWNEIRYLRRNPVVAKLCENEEDFRWSSAYREPNQTQARRLCFDNSDA
jgi:putative transposase